jgi:hypothetical protein
MKRSIKWIVSVVIIGLALGSCKDSDGGDPIISSTGVVVLNSGNFSDNNGSISIMQRSKDSAVVNNVIEAANKFSLNGIPQDYTEVDSLGIILVDNADAKADYVLIVNNKTFKELGRIPKGVIENPRNVLAISNKKAYVCAYGETGVFPDFFKNAGKLYIIDLSTFAVTKTIDIEKGAETMLKVGGEVFVGNAHNSNKMTVINTSDNTLKAPIVLPDSIKNGFNIIGQDAVGKIWIKSNDNFYRINNNTKVVEIGYNLSDGNIYTLVENPVFNKDKRKILFSLSYFDASFAKKGSVFSFGIDQVRFSYTDPLFKDVFIGGMGVDPINDQIYVGNFFDYKTQGSVARYERSGGALNETEKKAGIAPSKFYFREK